MISDICNFFKKVFYFFIFRILKIKYISKKTYHGYLLKVQIVDPISLEWYNKNWPNLLELEFIYDKILVKNNIKLIFDLGAHHGIIAMILARMFPLSKIISVEAIPGNNLQCEFNYKLNGINSITPLNFAISDSKHELEFENISNGVLRKSNKNNFVSVNTISIEDLISLYGMPDIIFIDIEGFEEKALKGIGNKEYIKNTIFFIEVHVDCGLELNNGSLKNIVNFFSDLNSFDLFSLKEGDLTVSILKDINDDIYLSRFYLLAIPKNCK